MKCRLARVPSNDAVIEVKDASGAIFGRLNAEVAQALAPLLDSHIKIRPQARLMNRKKKDGEMPGQPCSDHLKMIINVYGTREDAKDVGRFFGQRNIWFKPPMVSDPGIPVCNPHAERRAKQLQPVTEVKRYIRSETRTNEEAVDAVTRIFDHFASNANALEPTETPASLVTELLPHQKQALTFMRRCEQRRTYGSGEGENSSLWRIDRKQNGAKVYKEVITGVSQDSEPDEVLGGLLADVMGLGKTIEALALVASTLLEALDFSKEKLIRESAADTNLLLHTKGTLLVSPLTAVKNWEDQIREHVREGALSWYVYHGTGRTQNAFELSKYDVVITTYGTAAADFAGHSAKGSQSPLYQLKWFRVVLDEAHTIREQRANQAQAMFALWAQRRWCLTGTPIQNRIDDLGSLTRFIRLYPYDTAARFSQHIRAPFMAGDESFLKSLRVFVDSFTLRRLKDRVELPHREDLVDFLYFSPEEQKLYDFFKGPLNISIETFKRSKNNGDAKNFSTVLQGIMTLRLICAHGKELLKEKDLERLKGISANEAIDVDNDDNDERLAITERQAYDHLQMMVDADLDMCRECGKRIGSDSFPGEDGNSDSVRGYVLPCYDVLCSDCFQPCKEIFGTGKYGNVKVTCPFCSAVIASQYIGISALGAEAPEMPPETPPGTNTDPNPSKYYGGPHTKTQALLQEIETMKRDSQSYVERGEPPLKCVVFSEFTSHLDLIERALTDHNHTFVRIDGKMTLASRRKVLDALSTDDSVTILLASVKAAGQGLNLTSASRAFLMEPMWNPAAEAQAVDRVYRIGQKRDVLVKRFMMKDSIEGGIAALQKKKIALADMTMTQNHKALSRKEMREKYMSEILGLFSRK